MAGYARLDRARLEEALDALGRVLTDRGLRYHVVVLGGSALLLAEGSTRPTQDVDVAAVAAEDAPLRRTFELPKHLTEAIAWVNDRYPGGRCPGIDEVRRFVEERT